MSTERKRNRIVIALVGAPGGQGVSVLAAGLTAALSRKGSAALVDLNLERPSQALALDLNPARNLYMVLHEAGTQDDPTLWARLLESELQMLDTGETATDFDLAVPLRIGTSRVLLTPSLGLTSVGGIGWSLVMAY